MPITPQFLTTIRTLDDLIGLAGALGYEPRGDDLGREGRARLGWSANTGIQRAAIVGRHGSFVLYGAVVEQASRSRVNFAAERLARATPGERNLLLALDDSGATLAVASIAPGRRGLRPRQLRIALADPSRVAADILSRLTPRAGDTTLDLAVRCGDTLEEEGLTASFFAEYSAHHQQAADALRDLPRVTAGERRDLALILLTRVLFLYFIQAKGWLSDRRDFLAALLDGALRGERSFHHTVFEPLCFGALATPVAARGRAAQRLGTVPFLNGGLFERHALERRFPRAHLPNDAWRTLFDGLFERFRFTVREREDGDAVDPEMLGRVFEGLMARDRRRAAGAYYTPRALLRDTVRAALDAALDGAPAEAVCAIRILDPAVGSGAFLLESLVQLEQRRAHARPGEPAEAARRAIVRDNLFGVDVDPMAVRLAELRLWLAIVADDPSGWETVAPLPNLDLNIRQGDSLLSPLDYTGVVPAPAARPRLARVAESRAAYFAATGRTKHDLLRTLRADERRFAAETADAAIADLTARLADAASETGRDLFGARARRRPAAARRVSEWRRRRRELQFVRRRITAGDDELPFFSYDVQFADVLAAGGFDVVLGNPPWVRGERLPATTRTLLARRYESFAAPPERRGFVHIPDLSVAFVERSLQLVRDGGVVALVVPAKLLRAGYAGALRSLLRRRATVHRLDDRSHALDSGFAATVFPLLLVLRRGAAEHEARVSIHGPSGPFIQGPAAQDEIGLDRPPSRAPWLALPGDAVRAVRTALHNGPRLGGTFRPRLGVKTGANEVFVRPASRADELPRACRAMAILGRDLAPFRIRPSAAVLAAVDASGAPCRTVPRDVAEFLRPHASRLARRADARTASAWTLVRTDLLRGGWLVLWRDIAPRLEAAVLHRSAGGPVPLNTCYGVVAADAWAAWWLSAWLNSAPVRSLAMVLAERASGGAYRFAAGTVGALPLPRRFDDPAVRALAEIGRAAHEGGEWDDDALAHHATAALGLEPGVARILARLDHALRRSTDGDC